MNIIEQFTIDTGTDGGGGARVQGSALYGQQHADLTAQRGFAGAPLQFDIRLTSKRDLLTLADLLDSPNHGDTILWCSGSVTDGTRTDAISALRSRTSPLTASGETPNVWLEYIGTVPSDCEPRDAYASAFLDLALDEMERLAGDVRRVAQAVPGQ